MRNLTNTGQFAVDSMAIQTKVLKICPYLFDSIYLLPDLTVHNVTSHIPYFPADRPHIFSGKMGPKLGLRPIYAGTSVLTPH